MERTTNFVKNWRAFDMDDVIRGLHLRDKRSFVANLRDHLLGYGRDVKQLPTFHVPPTLVTRA
jgi:hypothetical protein